MFDTTLTTYLQELTSSFLCQRHANPEEITLRINKAKTRLALTEDQPLNNTSKSIKWLNDCSESVDQLEKIVSIRTSMQSQSTDIPKIDQKIINIFYNLICDIEYSSRCGLFTESLYSKTKHLQNYFFNKNFDVRITAPRGDSIIGKYVNKDKFVLVGNAFPFYQPIFLPVIEDREFFNTIGDRIDGGSFANIFAVNLKESSRIYKVQPVNTAANPDEFRVGKIAGGQGIAPIFYGVAVFNNEIYIEIERLGENLKKINQNETIEQVFGSKENYFFSFFQKIKELNSLNIRHNDCTPKNIIPHSELKNLKLIDFGSSWLGPDTIECARDFTSRYKSSFSSFRESATTEESQNLVKWFDKSIAEANKNINRRKNNSLNGLSSKVFSLIKELCSFEPFISLLQSADKDKN